MTDKLVLTEEDYVNRMFDALTSGSASEVNEIISAELESSADDTDISGADEQVQTDGESGESAASDSGPATEGSTAPDTTSETEEKDWREELPESIKQKVLDDYGRLHAEYKALEHYRSSNEGRVSGLQRKIQSLETQLAQVTSAAKPATTPATSTAATIEDDEFLADLKEQDPALYKVMKERDKALLEASKKQLTELQTSLDQKLNSVITPLQQEAELAMLRREAAIVKEQVPFVDKILASPQWSTFLNEAPEIVVRAAESKKADEFLAAIDMFATWASRKYPENFVDKPTTTATQSANVPGTQATASNKQLQDSRARRLQAGAVGTKHPPAAPIEELDEEALLERLFQDIRKKEGFTN